MAFLLIDHCHPWTHTNLRVEFGFPDHHGVRVKVFNATFNNISAISWWTVLLVEETGAPGENHRPATNH